VTFVYLDCRASLILIVAVHSTRKTQLRRVSGVQPILSEIETMVAPLERRSFSCSNTIRTARSLTSGKYRFDFAILQSSQDMESPGIRYGSLARAIVFVVSAK
jgi:hypothetical protein